MKFLAEIDIMPHKELLDPQGKTVMNNMDNLEIQGVEDMRIGKHIKMTLNADHEDEAKAKIEKACKQLLANLIMETYTYELKEVQAV